MIPVDYKIIDGVVVETKRLSTTRPRLDESKYGEVLDELLANVPDDAETDVLSIPNGVERAYNTEYNEHKVRVIVVFDTPSNEMVTRFDVSYRSLSETLADIKIDIKKQEYQTKCDNLI